MKKSRILKLGIIFIILILAMIFPTKSSAAWNLGIGSQLTIGMNNTNNNSYKLARFFCYILYKSCR